MQHYLDLTRRGRNYARRYSTTKSALGRLRPQGCPLGIDPSDWRKALSERLDQLLDAQMAIVDALDRMDGDPDLEETGDLEPSIGGNAPWGQEVDLELDDCDNEPDLSWSIPNAATSQIERYTTAGHWQEGESDGLEDGEYDDSDLDSGEPIAGGNERVAL